MVEKLNISAIYKSIILIFSVISFGIYLSTSFMRKKFKSNHQDNLENKIWVKFDKERWSWN